MGTTADKLNKLLETKQAIKQAIIDKGVDVADDTVFADYPGKIESIVTEGGNPYYEYLWNASTGDGTDYSYLFNRKSFTELDVSGLDTNKARNMEYMFNGCGLLTELDVSNFNTGNVTNMRYMFWNCSKLVELDVSNFNTGNVTDLSFMFCYCEKVKELDVSNFDTTKSTSLASMFQNCYELTSIKGINNFNVSKAVTIQSVFGNCRALTSLDVSNWDVGHLTASYYFESAFNNCTSLVDFYPPQNINAPMSVEKSTSLSHDSLIRILNNLMTQTSTKTLTLGSTNLAKLTAEEIAIATNKGWTVK